MPDPTMAKIMPTALEGELKMLSHRFRTRPNSVDVYNAIRDALDHGEAAPLLIDEPGMAAEGQSNEP